MTSRTQRFGLIVLLAGLFMVSPAYASHDGSPTDGACPGSWYPQYSVNCATGRFACGTASGVPQCVSSLPSGSVTGQALNCDTCSFACPSGQPIVCSGSCAPRQSCPTSQNRATTNECTGACGACRDGFVQSGSDTTGPCVPEPSRAYLNFDNTGELRAVNAFRVLGTDADVNDVYLNSGRAISVQGTGATRLDVIGAGTGNFGLVLRAPGAGTVAELRLAQGDVERWALSLRDTTGNFAIWRQSAGGWDSAPRLRIDYTTGEVRLEDSISVGGGAAFGRAISAPGATFTGAVEVTGLSAATGTVTGALAAGSISVGGRSVLTDPSPCAGGQVIIRNALNTAWECGIIAGGGGGILAEQDPIFSAWQTTGPRTLPDLTVTGAFTAGAVTGATVNATGCFGPTFVGLTDATVSGDNGGSPGYFVADDRCGVQFAASHVCTVSEILNSKGCDAAIFVGRTAGIGWILNGPPGFPANSNDCGGRTSAVGDDFGSIWVFSSTGGQGLLTPCSTNRAFACCR